MRASYIITLGLIFLCAGCSKQAGIPLRFYLSEQEPKDSVAAIPNGQPALVVSQVQLVASDPSQRKLTIKLFPPDATAFEKLTTDNYGQTIVLVQGSKVLASPRVSEPIPARAGITFPVSTNLDFQSVYRRLQALSK